jgi:type I restriction enzyme R subunit
MNNGSTTEKYKSQLPALMLLSKLGYKYLTPSEVNEMRGGFDQVILSSVLKEWLQENNQYEFRGGKYDFSEQSMNSAVEKIRDIQFEGLIHTNEKVYYYLLLGESFPEEVNGMTKSFSLKYIDWKNPEKNKYHVTQELSVERKGKIGAHRRLDIVVYVNGIPLVAIECKKPGGAGPGSIIERAVRDLLVYQRPQEIPQLFVYSQLLLVLSGNQALYGTTETPLKFWSVWREQDENFDVSLKHLINRNTPEELKHKLISNTEDKDKALEIINEFESIPDRTPNRQDILLNSLLKPERMLDIIRNFIVFDNGTKKAPRYQQYFAVQKTLTRVKQYAEPDRRRGGIIWHTTGSGKSITMVMIAKAIFNSSLIKNPRVILVTDRTDLDEQLKDNFNNCGIKTKQATTGKNLYELIRDKKTSVITTIVNKFMTLIDKFKHADNDENTFLLVDEGHRSHSHGGNFHDSMLRAFPKACAIAFTGTPLTRDDKSRKLWDDFIHVYSMADAIKDKAVVPLLYEGRIVDLKIDSEEIDKQFEEITAGLPKEEVIRLKKFMVKQQSLWKAENRIRLIAEDIIRHYTGEFQGTGKKGQLAVSSKSEAVLFKKIFDESGKIKSEVIISGPSSKGEDEDNEDNDDNNQTPLDNDNEEQTGDDPDSVEKFWNEMMELYGSESSYNKKIIAAFKGENGPELIIVVNKLLTGFDAPRNSVLYIDRVFVEHNVLQAIARVNRLFDCKDYGYIIDYRGILGKLNDAMDIYDKLSQNYDEKDLQSYIDDIKSIIKRLPEKLNAIDDVFKTLTTAERKDPEKVEKHLEPENNRQRFYDCLNEYTKAMRTILGTRTLYRELEPQKIQMYKDKLVHYENLRRSVRQRFLDQSDNSEIEKRLEKLINTHVGAEKVEVLTDLFNIHDKEKFLAEVAKIDGHVAQADRIVCKTKAVINERINEDPTFYRKISAMLDDAIADYIAKRVSEVSYLDTVKEIHKRAVNKIHDDVPDKLQGKHEAIAYFGRLKEIIKNLESETVATISADLQGIISSHKIRDWSTNSHVRNLIMNDIDDYFYDKIDNEDLDIDQKLLDLIAQDVIRIAENWD